MGPLWPNQGSENEGGAVSHDGSQVESVVQPDTSGVAHAASAIKALRERGLAVTSDCTIVILLRRQVPTARPYPQHYPARQSHRSRRTPGRPPVDWTLGFTSPIWSQYLS